MPRISEVDMVNVEQQEMESRDERALDAERGTTWLSHPHDVTAAKGSLGVSMFVSSSSTYAFLSQIDSFGSHLCFHETLLRP